MSFSDLISSSKGPGVIGLLMAVLILAGFGGLSLLALDPKAQGGSSSIESVIKEQAQEIDYSNQRIQASKKTLDKSYGLKLKAENLAKLKAASAGRMADMEAAREAVESKLAEVRSQQRALENYKDSYRQMVRAAAKGESIPELRTLDGCFYKGVRIREVSAVGIHISHEEGIKRIPFDLLPMDYQERFQYDANQKDVALKQEIQAREQHEEAVDLSNQEVAQAASVQKDKAAQAAKKALSENYQAQLAMLRKCRSDVMILERELSVERRKPLSRAPAIEAQLAQKKQQLVNLQAVIAQMKASL